MSRIVLALVLALSAGPAAAGPADLRAGFAAFLEGTVVPAARAAGLSDRTVAEALDGLSPDLDLPDLVRPGTTAPDAFQAEFRSPARYLDEGNLSALARAGRALLGEHRDVLAAIERETGVPAEIVVAVWGRESNFGRAEVGKDAIRTLATQAFMGARREMFLAELLAALRILEDGHVPRAALRSSWAGALGQPQFLPSKFLAHAADGDGDGRRDIWTSVPDTLASIAAYLSHHGWRPGAGWGAEALVPETVSCTLEGPDQGRPAAFWTKAGARRVDGEDPAALGDTLHLMMPSGRAGPAFLVTANFYVLKAYNESDLYALFVGHLADRIAGEARIRGGWPATGGFTRRDVRDLQARLIAAGHDVGGADGLVGFRTRVAIGREQEKDGRPVTCFPGPAEIR